SMAERADEHLVRAVEIAAAGEQQIAQVPQRRSQIGIERERALERFDRRHGLAVLLQDHALVVVGAGRARRADRAAGRRPAVADALLESVVGRPSFHRNPWSDASISTAPDASARRRYSPSRSSMCLK